MAALTTSKRKFHKILENISASASSTTLHRSRDKHVSTVSLAGGLKEPPSKRSRTSMDSVSVTSGDADRLGTSGSTNSRMATPGSQGRLSLAQRAKSVRLVGKNQDKGKQTQEQRKSPNYTPWNHDAFVERLKTFADVKLWSPKPDKLSEVEWAKRGWICEGFNTVACKGGCEKRIVVKLEPKKGGADEEALDQEVDESLVERYATLIIDGHEEGCLWRRGGCKGDIYHVPMANYDDHVKPGLIDRHKSLLNVRFQLPPLKNLQFPGREPEKLEKALPEELTQQLSSENFETTAPDDGTDQTDLEKRLQLFALYGWYGEERGKYSIVSCKECHQRTGLWLYTGDDKLDLVEAHRVHCPWQNPESQGGGKALWHHLQNRLITRLRHETESIAPTEISTVSTLDNTSVRPASSVADSETADKNRLHRLKKAMKGFGRLKK
ncbi:C3HC zinc finger-like-domain-containing protein [Phyllosticta paracitricarpa]|uniref:C3HC zinc finger-like-domain-containing protein n=2 Tax=Phyllosticta TaxID=121621 RepID=A0ABR1MEE9_9PEZI